MKIFSSKPIESKRTGRTQAKGGSSSGFAQHLSSVAEAEAPASAMPTANISATDAIFAAQVVEDATAEANRKAKRTGAEMLEHLEDIRMGLLTGSIPKKDLAHLAQLSRLMDKRNLEPKMAEIMEDIDTRVQVELAKLAKIV